MVTATLRLTWWQQLQKLFSATSQDGSKTEVDCKGASETVVPKNCLLQSESVIKGFDLWWKVGSFDPVMVNHDLGRIFFGRFFFPKIFTASHKNHFQRCWICISCLQMDQSHDSWRIETSGSTVFWGIFSLSLGDGGFRRIPKFRGRIKIIHILGPPATQDPNWRWTFFLLVLFSS